MRAYALSSYSGSSNPTENVLTPSPLILQASAVTRLESTPPLQNVPTGTSLIRRIRTESSSSSARVRCDSSNGIGGGLGAGPRAPQAGRPVGAPRPAAG